MWMYHNKQYMYVTEEVSEGKTLGEMWVAVIRNINNLLRTRGFGRGPIGESVDAQKGTMLDIFERCLKKEITKYVHCQVVSSMREELLTNITFTIAYQWVTSQETQRLHCKVTVNHWMRNNLLNPFPCIYVHRNCPCYNRCSFFCRVKNKPWIPWVYTWSWHYRNPVEKTATAPWRWTEHITRMGFQVVLKAARTPSRRG